MANLSKPIRAPREGALSFESSQLLTIRVGVEPDSKDFIAHESFLTSRSEFFRRAMNGNWEESESRVVKMPEDQPGIFALYIEFIYTGQLRTANCSDEEYFSMHTGKITAKRVGFDEYDRLFRFYVLADKLQDTAAKNTAIAAVLEHADYKRPEGMDKQWICPMAHSCNYVYENTRKGSRLRHLVAGMCASHRMKKLLGSIRAQELCEELVEDVAELLEEFRSMVPGKKTRLFNAEGVGACLETE